MGKREIKLSFKELKELINLNKIRRRRRDQKNKKSKVNKSSFPNSAPLSTASTSPSVATSFGGPSMATRELDTIRGQLNDAKNLFIKNEKPKEKSYFHALTEQLANDVLSGKRDARHNKDGSFGITELFDKRKEKGIKSSKKGRNVVEVVDGDGMGDFGKSRFTRTKAVDTNALKNVSRRKADFNPQPPKLPPFIPTGDNIDTATSVWTNEPVEGEEYFGDMFEEPDKYDNGDDEALEEDDNAALEEDDNEDNNEDDIDVDVDKEYFIDADSEEDETKKLSEDEEGEPLKGTKVEKTKKAKVVKTKKTKKEIGKVFTCETCGNDYMSTSALNKHKKKNNH